MTVPARTADTTELPLSREQFPLLRRFGVRFRAAAIPLSARRADRHGRRPVVLGATLAIGLFGLAFAPLVGSGSVGLVTLFMALGLALMGLTYAPLGTLLGEQFPTRLRYTGVSPTFNLAGILGAALAPYAATWLANRHGLPMVGLYLSSAALISALALTATADSGDHER